MQWGRCDYKQLQKLQQNLQKLQSMDLTRFCEEASRELAARLLALVIPRTPVGKYPTAYANSLPVFKRGRNFYIEVINPVHYASYVEFGHRTRGGQGWVAGQYFLTLSERDLERMAPAILEKKLERLLREAFNV